MKKKIYVLILCVLIVLLLIFLYFLKGRNKSEENKKDYGKLMEVSYSCSGDMLGNHYKISLDTQNNVLSVSDAKMHSDPILIREYKVLSNDKVDHIKSLISDFDLPKLSDAENDDNLFVYDACTPHFTFIYKTGKKSYDQEYYSFSMYYKMTRFESEALYKIKKDLESLQIADNLINEYYKESD